MNIKQGRVSLTCLPAIALVLLAGLAPALGAEESQGSPCSVASMHGSYGFYRTGKSVCRRPCGLRWPFHLRRSGKLEVDSEHLL